LGSCRRRYSGTTTQSSSTSPPITVVVGDQQNGTRDRDAEHQQADDRHLVGELDEMLLVVLAEQHPVHRRWGDQERGRHRRRHQHAEVEVALLEREVGEALGEGHGEQEREQHLHAGQRDAQLLEQLTEVPVGAFGARLATPGGGAPLRRLSALGRWHRRRLTRRYDFVVITTIPTTMPAAVTASPSIIRAPAANAATGRSSRRMSAKRAAPKIMIEKAAVIPTPATSEATTV
jgi:hypothetical protein